MKDPKPNLSRITLEINKNYYIELLGKNDDFSYEILDILDKIDEELKKYE